MSDIKILALSGSSRAGSYNTTLLHTAARIVPKGVDLDIYSGLEKLPFYSDELDGELLHPEAGRLRAAVAAADGVLLAVPEYNYSLTALLKNALDWASRPAGRHVFLGKPTAIIGASSSILGTVRAQLHTRDVLHALQADVVPRPEVLVTQAAHKIANGQLSDETARALLAEVLENLVRKIEHKRILAKVAQDRAS